jgi:sugar phosphate isomerase/epimerase
MNFAANRNVSRRDFLKVAGLTTVAPLLSSCARREKTKEKWQMRLSTSSIHFMQLPIEQACEKIASLGFEAIDIWSAHAGCPHLDDVANRLGAEGLREVLTKNNLKLFAFSVYKGGYEKYADLLGKAGGGVAVQGSTKPCEPQALTSRMRQFIKGQEPLIELAEKHDSYLAIENHGGALLNSLDSLKAFVEMNTSPRLGIALAPYHLQTIKASVPEAIRICGNQLFFFYAWQHYEGHRQLPGIGPTNMTSWIQALADVRYRGYVNPFMHGHPPVDVMAANLAKSRGYLKNCYNNISPRT